MLEHDESAWLGTVSSAAALAGALRAYFRYRSTCGDVVHALLGVIASPARWTLASLPRSLTADEVRRLLGLQFVDGERPVSELPQQQLADDTQPALTRAGCKAACIAHVRVIAAQFLGNGAGGQRPFRNDALLPKHRQQMSQAGTEVAVCAQRSGVAIAARQMVVEELSDEVFVELLSYQAAASCGRSSSPTRWNHGH